ncbi:dethiobiotin synthase [Paraferrimonas sp. SM1919]|uniref:dethiobiotin synthase n=1 Tax=Paraferrimonas sp. SM1919 TaxID=2662263 RepID=UPI0013D838DF|nr:dethiobiotin synthase [Paraferrimonas sp. SM1919]
MYFVTGTDTDAGKTLVSSGLLHLAKQQGSTLGIKPIASGCEWIDNRLSNADARSLINESTIALDYQQHNPFSFEPAIAPHIAAIEAGVDLTLASIDAALPKAAMGQADFCLVEGAGGWQLPINGTEYLPTLVLDNQWPIILVVGMKLGCLNHALLTQQVIEAQGGKVVGWVANRVDKNMSRFEDNLKHLQQAINAPCLGVVPYLDEISTARVANYLALP